MVLQRCGAGAETGGERGGTTLARNCWIEDEFREVKSDGGAVLGGRAEAEVEAEVEAESGGWMEEESW